jgi:hypothetical protein
MRRLLVIVLALAAFVVVTVVLARWLTTPNEERDQVTQLLKAQARGDADSMLDRLDGCLHRPSCVGTVRDNATRLRSPGEVEIVAYDSSTAYAFGSGSGPTRVVWRTPDRLTTVQCVEVRREGSIVSGPSVRLTGVSAPIARTAAC